MMFINKSSIPTFFNKFFKFFKIGLIKIQNIILFKKDIIYNVSNQLKT